MLYKSTRGGDCGSTFEKALFSGYASDGGLFVPEEIPILSSKVLTEWRTLKLTYPEVVNKIVRMYISPDEISNDDLHNCVRRAYNTFSKEEIIGVQEVKDISGESVKIAELYHGRTGSFKDLGMSLVGQLLSHFMAKRKDHVVVLIATSGDTGSAAIEAVRGSKDIDIIVLYPKGMISQVQEWQMRSATEENVHLFEVEGTSDDADLPIKQSFPANGIMSINSINWARIMIQTAHYVYLHLLDGEEIEVVIPTGAAGNLSSGIFAVKMGVPLKLYVATNKNDCVDTFLSKGILKFFNKIEPTPANAMDIANPYNIERVIYLFSNSKMVLTLMDKGEVRIPTSLLEAVREVVKGSLSVDAKAIYETIKTCWDINKYLICPHTATGMYYFNRKLSDHPRVYILSTATPFKFFESIEMSGIPRRCLKAKNPFVYLTSCPKVQPKTMKKGEDWFQLLQNEINSIKAKH